MHSPTCQMRSTTLSACELADAIPMHNGAVEGETLVRTIEPSIAIQRSSHRCQGSYIVPSGSAMTLSAFALLHAMRGWCVAPRNRKRTGTSRNMTKYTVFEGTAD